MFSFLSIDFVSQFVIFLFGSFLAFYIPGNVFVRKLKFEPIISLTLSYILGISLWSIQGFIFGLLSLRELTYLYLGIFVIYWTFVNFNSFKGFKLKPFKKPDNKNLIIATVIITGILLQLFSIIWNYFPFNNGLIFIAGSPDNLYHAGVLRELIDRVPPLEPGVSNFPIYNYHFLSNLIGADFVRVFNVNYLYLDFHFLVLLLTVLFGLSIYAFGKTLNIGRSYILLLLIIIYFVGDLLPYLTLVTQGDINFLGSTLENPLSLWISFSRYLGIILYFGALTTLLHWIKTKNKFSALIFAIILGSIIGFKVYIGILGLIGIIFLSIYFIYKKRFLYLLPAILTLTISLILYFPINKNAGGLVFTGLWRFEDFIANSYWGLSKFELARHVYLESNNYPKIILYELFYIFIYIIFSVGFLLTGFLNTKSSLKKFPTELHIFLIPSLIVTSILAFFFIQTSGGANSFQFTISIYIIGSIYSALAINRLIKSSNKLLLFVVILLLLLSFIRVMGISYTNLNKLLGKTSVYFVNSEYLDALEYLKKTSSKSGIVLTDPSLGNDCIFVKLLAEKNIYFCEAAGPGDKGIIDVLEKRESVYKMLYEKDEEIIKSELKLNNIEYVVATKSAFPNLFNEVYSNDKYQILILEK